MICIRCHGYPAIHSWVSSNLCFNCYKIWNNDTSEVDKIWRYYAYHCDPPNIEMMNKVELMWALGEFNNGKPSLP